MKIGFICKYPPISGGVTSRTYWLTRALADRGHEIHIITNANEVETDYKEKLSDEDKNILYDQKNIFIHSTSYDDMPEIRPIYNPFETKLANVALKVIKEHKLDIIDSWFFVPNSVAGYMVKQITNIPWVVRHGGSDIATHLPSKHFDELLKEILKKADKIVTHATNKEAFISRGILEEKLWVTITSFVNRKYFNADIKPTTDIPQDKPVIMNIGKIFREKGVYDLLQSFAPIKDKALLVFVTAGPGLDNFKNRIEKLGIKDSVKIFSPIPPWKIPSYIKAATCFVHVERNFLIPHYPIVPREVIACKKCIMLSDEMYKKYPFFEDNKNVLVVDPTNHSEFTSKLQKIIENHELRKTIEENAYQASIDNEDYEKYIDIVEGFYNHMLSDKLKLVK